MALFRALKVISLNRGRTIMNRIVAGMILVLIVAIANANAESHVVSNQRISVFVQSVETDGEQAHMVATEEPFSSSCSPAWHNRAYILATDKSLFAAALSAAISGQPINFYYDDAALPVNINGHEGSLRCRINSIWLPW